MGESLKRSLRLRRFGCTFALHLARQQLLQRQLRQVFRLFFLLFGEVVDAAVVRLGVGGWLPSRSAHHKNHSKQEKKKKRSEQRYQASQRYTQRQQPQKLWRAPQNLKPLRIYVAYLSAHIYRTFPVFLYLSRYSLC